MGTFCHKLKENKTGEFPRNWCFVDTETVEIKIDDKTKKQVLRLGTAIYKRDGIKGKKSRNEKYEFREACHFWDWITQVSEPDRRLVLLAYNVGFDSRILNMFKILPEIGYELINLFDKGQVFIASFKRGKHKITILDAMNYFTGKLSEWGDMLDIPKGEVDFKNVSNKKLMEYCHRDTAILAAIWVKWRSFIDKHDLGCFSPTKSSQALGAFRHRFMTTSIFIHANSIATQIERDSYYGGRTECFRLGEIKGGPFYKVDVNSFYPYIMSKTAVPVKFKRVVDCVTIKDLKKIVKSYGAVASVRIKTDIPAYPFRRRDGLIYPIGEFNVTLAGPELIFALKRGHIRKVYRLAIYDVAIVFRKYVRELYALRQEYKAKGNRIFEQLIKYLLDCLYGKFAQRNEEWKRLDVKSTAKDGTYYYPNETLDCGDTYRIVAGTVFKFMGIKDSMHSFHAISSYITSAARVHLWNLIEKAGRSHVFYIDTDSLIVDSVGHENLASVLDNSTLGMLKLEYVTKLLRIYAPKDYQTGSELHIKGVSKSYKRVKKNVYTGWQWEGVRGAIRNDNLDCVFMYKRNKVLRRDCRKGVVQSSGSVLPFVLSGESALSRSSILRN